MIRRYTAVVLLHLLVASACGQEVNAVGTLTHAEDSPEALARSVLDAVAADDREALRRRMVTREEYREIFWPELPENGHLPFEMAWQMNQASSRKALNNVLASFGGTRFELVSVEFTEPEERYETFTVHRGAELRVRRLADGREGVFELLDVVAERDGRWKSLDFDDD